MQIATPFIALISRILLALQFGRHEVFGDRHKRGRAVQQERAVRCAPRAQASMFWAVEEKPAPVSFLLLLKKYGSVVH